MHVFWSPMLNKKAQLFATQTALNKHKQKYHQLFSEEQKN